MHLKEFVQLIQQDIEEFESYCEEHAEQHAPEEFSEDTDWLEQFISWRSTR